VKIEWEYPEPRRGLFGAWDTFIGPGATVGENVLIVSVAISAAVLVPAYAIAAHIGWSGLQLAIAALMALDLAGGVVANATSATKRWYFRKGQGFWQHMGFTALHIYPFVVAWAFLNNDWSYAIIVYGYLILAAAVILKTPLYLQRPVALTLFMGGLIMSIYVLAPLPGLEWFVPVLYLKMIIGHLVREEPYRPG
jgi:hypothetical protein